MASCGRSIPVACPKPASVAIQGDVIDPRLAADGVEVRRRRNARCRCAAPAVPWPPFVDPAMVVMPVERDAAGAMDGELVVDGSAFPDAARAMMGLNVEPGACCAWMARFSMGLSGLSAISFQSLDLMRTANLLGSKVGRLTMASTSPVRGSSATTAPFLAVHGQFGHRLQVQVDGELQILAGNRRLVLQRLPHLAAIVHHHLALPVHAHQRVVVLALDAELADHRRRDRTWRTPGDPVPLR